MRICIVDDHEVVRAGLRAMFTDSAKHEVVADASSGRDALAIAKRELPDAIISEYRLPDMAGYRLCREVHKRFPGTAVVFLSSQLSEDRVNRAMLAGAAGFVTKSAGLAELDRVLDDIHAGHTAAPLNGGSGTVQHLLRCSNETGAARRLTPRQERVLELAAQGLTYSEISQVLEVSESTVRFHIQSLKERLAVRTRAELVALAVREALIPV